MSNPLNAGQSRRAQMPDFNQLYQQFIQNPMKYLTGLDIPQNIQTPKEVVQFLANNGKIPPLIQRQVYSMLRMK